MICPTDARAAASIMGMLCNTSVNLTVVGRITTFHRASDLPDVAQSSRRLGSSDGCRCLFRSVFLIICLASVFWPQQQLSLSGRVVDEDNHALKRWRPRRPRPSSSPRRL
jgi:hypothetical protein